MDFRCFCEHKGCRKEMRPVVDKQTLLAYCTECDQELANISIFMRRQMVSEGQIKTNVKAKMPWSVKCSECSHEGQPIFRDNKLFCSGCKEELSKLSKPFVDMIKTHLKSIASAPKS